MRSKKEKRIFNGGTFFKLLLLSLFLLPLSVEAVGVAVSPSSVDLLFPDISEEKISIKNISSEPIVVRVYTDDFADNISIEPNEFELLPDQVSPVKISGDFDNFEAGIQKTDISILSKAKDKKSFNAISGIKIPLSIYISKSYFTWSGPAIFVVVFFGLLLILGLVRIIIIIFTKKPQKKSSALINLLIHHKKKKWYKFW
jgi:hypothetical protein